MNFNRLQRKHLADKLMDTANLVLGGLVIGQMVDRSVGFLLILSGLLFYVIAVIVTTQLQQSRKESGHAT